FQTRHNRPFSFRFDDSRTELRTSLDLPLNRRQQRNAFRQSLINYQAGRRGLTALEDNIKFDARQDLRQLDLARVQYDIAVVSSALASERVNSTQLEITLGLASVAARDFLEAQRAYRESVSSVANGRLGYIVNRAQLAFDLELMMLNDAGLWPDLNNENYQPLSDPIYPSDAGPTYGDLPRGVWPSKKIKRMLRSPLPGYQVIGVERPPENNAPSEIEAWEANGDLPPPPPEPPSPEPGLETNAGGPRDPLANRQENGETGLRNMIEFGSSANDSPGVNSIRRVALPRIPSRPR
ncbi:MAG: TolC family protein, partial [Planctomycetales bacterium]